MKLALLEEKYPDIRFFTEKMSPTLKQKIRIVTYTPREIIHQKDSLVQDFGIVVTGETRVINAFENGSIYLIETNHAIDFIGEVALLAHMPTTSVTIEATAPTTVLYLPRTDAENWIFTTPDILQTISHRVAYKLYRSSYNNGLKLFYPPSFLLADYIIKFYEQNPDGLPKKSSALNYTLTLRKTREALETELGITVKTLNRTIHTMHQKGFFIINKGKITITPQHYEKLKEYLRTTKN